MSNKEKDIIATLFLDEVATFNPDVRSKLQEVAFVVDIRQALLNPDHSFLRGIIQRKSGKKDQFSVRIIKDKFKNDETFRQKVTKQIIMGIEAAK